MRARWIRCFGLSAATALLFGGCNFLPTVTTPVSLGSSLGEFDVQAGVPASKRGSLSFDTGGVTAGRGSISLDPSVITVVPTGNGGGKIAATLQGSLVMQVTVWVGSPGQLETVFDDGDEYGPFSVTLETDEDGTLTGSSISPQSVNLTTRTIELLNGGQMSVGVEVVSPVTGFVAIESFDLNLGL